MNKLFGFAAVQWERSAWDAVLTWLSMLAMGSYLLFYVTIPGAYEVGPAMLLALAFANFGFRWKKAKPDVDRESCWMLGVLLASFLVETLLLVLHGEDASEFDLSTRCLAAAIVMLFLLNYSIRVSAFFFLVALGGVLTGLHAFYQAEVAVLARVQSFDNPIHYGNGALALAFISFAGIVWSVRQRPRVLWTGLLLMGVVGGLYASLVSETRSGWVAFPVAVILGLFAYWKRLRRIRWLIPAIVAGVIIFIAGISQIGFVQSRATVAVNEFEAYYDQGENGTSVGLRLDMWKAGLLAFADRPLIGEGPSGKDAYVHELVEAGEINPNVEGFRHLHNQYVDNMARYGLVGLTSYLALLMVTFGLFMRKARSELPAVRALGLAGAFFVSVNAVVNLTQSMLERNIGVMMFVFMIVFIWVVLKREETAYSAESDVIEN